MKSVRRLGLAALMAMALLVVPSVASASGGIVADKYRTVLRAEQSSGFFYIQLESSPPVSCNTGTMLGEIKGPSAKYGLSGEEGWCSYAGGKSEIKMNACKLEFEPGTQTFGVGPVGCGGINMSVGACPIELVPQTGLPATQSNAAEGDVSILVETGTSIKFYVAKKVGGCPEVGYHEKGLTLGSGFELDVEGYESNSIKEGELKLGPATDIAVFASGALPVGVFTTGTLDQWDAQAFPAQYHAAPVASQKLKLLGAGTSGNVFCETADATKIEALASAVKFIEFGGCTFGGSAATVKANSCSYEFTAKENSGDKADVRVACTKEGDVVEIATSVCTLTVPAQSLTGSEFTAEDQGEGYDATVHANSAATGMKYSNKKDKPGCALLNPNGTNGTFTADVTLSGTYAG